MTAVRRQIEHQVRNSMRKKTPDFASQDKNVVATVKELDKAFTKLYSKVIDGWDNRLFGNPQKSTK